MPLVLLPADERQPQPWRNGGGITYEVARASHPARPQDYLWRVSIAEVSAPGPFSLFVGYQRVIAVIAGAGMSLRGLAPDEVTLAPFQVTRFDGALAVEGLLPNGPVQDFNVIFDPAICSARLAFAEGAGARPVTARSTLLVNVDAEPCEWRCRRATGALAQLDAVELTEARGETLEWRDAVRVALVEIAY
jgi:environmental stress-induced protein Ves